MFCGDLQVSLIEQIHGPDFEDTPPHFVVLWGIVKQELLVANEKK